MKEEQPTDKKKRNICGGVLGFGNDSYIIPVETTHIVEGFPKEGNSVFCVQQRWRAEIKSTPFLWLGFDV